MAVGTGVAVGAGVAAVDSDEELSVDSLWLVAALDASAVDFEPQAVELNATAAVKATANARVLKSFCAWGKGLLSDEHTYIIKCYIGIFCIVK